jgi:multisubunit Na+/H+ antiporter MnhB subunit
MGENIIASNRAVREIFLIIVRLLFGKAQHGNFAPGIALQQAYTLSVFHPELSVCRSGG